MPGRPRIAIAGRPHGGGATGPSKKTEGVDSNDNNGSDDGALAELFARELEAVLRAVRDRQRRELGEDASIGEGFDADREPAAECPQVAHYGALGQRLLGVTNRLLGATGELALAKKFQLLLVTGDSLLELHEHRAAERHCYARIVQRWEARGGGGATSPHGDREDDDDDALESYVRALYGVARCIVHRSKLADPLVRFPGTLEGLVAGLSTLQRGMDLAVKMEARWPHRFAWLILNGSIHVYSAARALLGLGFPGPVMPYLKWCLLALESSVLLCTSKYIMWRLQICAALCDGYERLASSQPKRAPAHLKAAVACAEHALRGVTRLRKEEELDLPVPKHVAQVLSRAEQTANFLALRARLIAKGESIGKRTLDAAVDTESARMRLAVDALEKAPPGSLATTSNDELVAYVLDLAKPYIEALDNDASRDHALAQVDRQFPLEYHLSLLRYCSLHERTLEAAQTLIRTGMWRAKDRRLSASPKMFQVELELHASLIRLAEVTLQPAAASSMVELQLSKRSIPIAEIQCVSCSLNALLRASTSALVSKIRDLVIGTALRLWTQGVQPILSELDANPPESHPVELVETACTWLFTLHRSFCEANFDDMLLSSEVSLRLGVLLRYKRRYRHAVQICRQALRRIDSYRDQLADERNHFSSTRSSSQQSVGSFTFSFDVPESRGHTDCTGDESYRKTVGVEGTGSQAGSLSQELSCVQVDLLLLLFECELGEAQETDTLDIGTATMAHKADVLALNFVESAMQKEFRKNCYARLLLNTRRILVREGDEQRCQTIITECFELLRRAFMQERELIKAVDNTNEEPGETMVPQPPQIIARCSTTIAVKVIEYLPSIPSLRRRKIAYYMVFAKASGAGTDVSLNNTEFPGTGEPIYPGDSMTVTITCLNPNDSYVFAVAAFDENDEIIQAIGETSKPVVAANPLSLVLCSGYLAQACYKVNNVDSARKFATEVYQSVASHEGASRATWEANPFYRSALKRGQIARWPIPLLRMIVRCILVLCHDEPGLPERDGEIASDNQALSLRQIDVLETSRRLAIGIEVATAVGDAESIRTLSFKGYRTLLPLLHLDSVNSLTLAALMTFYQGLMCIQRDAWDVDTSSIASRFAFELIRIAQQNRFVTQVIYKVMKNIEIEQSGSTHTDSKRHEISHEMRVLHEYVALLEVKEGGELVPRKPPQTPSSGTAKTPAASKSLSTPHGTPRSDDGSILQLPRLRELTLHAKLELKEAFKALEAHSSNDCQVVEMMCKLLYCGLERGEDTWVEEVLSGMKIVGNYGKQLAGTLRDIGMTHLLPDRSSIPASTAIVSPPASARISKTPRSEATKEGPPVQIEAKMDENDDVPEFGDDDDYLFVWVGEMCLLQVILQYRKIVKCWRHTKDVDVTTGPNFDYSFDILHGRNVTSVGMGELSMKADCDLLNFVGKDDDRVVFRKLISLVSSCCRLFTLGKSWKGLQIATQFLWNGICLSWVPPDYLAFKETEMNGLVCCIDALLDMLEMVTNAVATEKSSQQPSLADQETQTQSKVAMSKHPSTAVYVSTMSVISADQTWIARLVEYSLQALVVCRDWAKIVQIGKRYHVLSGGKRFSERNFPLLLHAQEQYLAEQNAVLSRSQQILASFVKEFLEAEAKKKKKKSRLVVEEILTPEEIEFRAAKTAMETDIMLLTQERDRRSAELSVLQRIQDGLSRTINKTVQCLDHCHELLEKYRRGDRSSTISSQIKQAFFQCVTLGRQKRQKHLVCRALHELGDFCWETGDSKAALKAWNDSIDNAFSTLHVTSSWRTVLPATDSSVKEYGMNADNQIEGDGLWICLGSCVVLAKLMLHYSGSHCANMTECALMSAAIMSRVFKCSLPHPTRDFLFRSYTMAPLLWPGREILADSERLSAAHFGIAIGTIPQVLLSYEYSIEALPAIALYEVIAAHCFEDSNHIANSRRLRMLALAQCGQYREALITLGQILDDVEENTSIMKKSKPGSVLGVLDFKENRSLHDGDNTVVVNWISSLDVVKVENELAAHFSVELARLILVDVLKVIVGLSRQELIHHSTVRSAAMKIAQTLTSLCSPVVSSESNPSETPRNRPWSSFICDQLRAEAMIQQSYISAHEGLWNQSREQAEAALTLVHATAKVLQDSAQSSSGLLDFDQQAKFSLVYRPSTLIAKCRMQSIICDINNSQFHDALHSIEIALAECDENMEEYFRQRLILLRAQVLILLGSSRPAIQNLSALMESMQTSLSHQSTVFVRASRLRNQILRAEAIEHNKSASLQGGLLVLETAEDALDQVLNRCGWIGVGVDSVEDPRLNLYIPMIPLYVELKADLAQALLECPSQDVEEAQSRGARCLDAIDCAVRALRHTTKPLLYLKAQLLVMRGVVLKRSLESDTKERDHSLTDPERVGRHQNIVETFISSIEESIREGGLHDRELIRAALINLVDLYCQKLLPGKEDEHIQASYHYLSLAVRVLIQQTILCETMELQNGTVSGLDKLPAFIMNAITKDAGTTEPRVISSIPAPPVTSTVKGGAAPPAASASKIAAVDASRVINFFIKVLRDKIALTESSFPPQDIAIILHSFLQQNHSTYASMCCLSNVPAVPTTDPEIKAGLVCAHWGRDLAVGLSPAMDRNSTATLYFVLGTTKIDVSATTSGITHDSANARMEYFATVPLMSRRPGIDERAIRLIRDELADLRVLMEDEDSITINRADFPKMLIGILVSIQQTFYPPQSEKTNRAKTPATDDDTDLTASREVPEAATDRFGNVIPLPCTLPTVKQLEELLTVQRGVSTIDPLLCYFLRDLFDAAEN